MNNGDFHTLAFMDKEWQRDQSSIGRRLKFGSAAAMRQVVVDALGMAGFCRRLPELMLGLAERELL
ncbi:hypothetical protein [Pseudomonas sp. CBC3]|uniref:hypothetical protein n=1 Tax=Pseudomonas sp. CBC3 TaxID=3123318 RepID=UPI0030E8C34B